MAKGSPTKRLISIRVVLILIVSILFALEYGLNFGISNQNTYLVHGLKMAHPELYQNDWFVQNSTDYHPVFSFLSHLLFKSSSPEWLFAIINIILVAAGCLIIYMFMSLVVDDRIALPAFFILMAMLSITETFSIAGSYIFSGILQPSTLGGLGFLLALLFFYKERYLYSGLAWAAGGLFHANYLVLGFIFFLAPHVFSGRQKRIRGVLIHYSFPLITFLALMPLFLKTAGSPNFEASQTILFKIRSPHHYNPYAFKSDIIGFAGWPILAIPAIWLSVIRRYLGRVSVVHMIWGLILLAIATMLTSLVFIPKVAQLYVYRLAPFVVLISQIIAAGIATVILMHNRKPGITRFPAFIFGVIGLLLICVPYLQRDEIYKVTWLWLILLSITITAALSTRLFKNEGARLRAAASLGLILFLICAAQPLANISARSSLISGISETEEALYAWARRTDLDSVFLIPPEMQNFRLHAQRAVVVDWKSTPLVPEQLFEWYGRINEISGDSAVSGLSEASNGYREMSPERLSDLQKKYKFDYAVFRTVKASELDDSYEMAYINEKFVAYRCNTITPENMSQDNLSDQ